MPPLGGKEEPLAGPREQLDLHSRDLLTAALRVADLA